MADSTSPHVLLTSPELVYSSSHSDGSTEPSETVGGPAPTTDVVVVPSFPPSSPPCSPHPPHPPHPVLHNLAQAALEHIKTKRALEVDEDNDDDFKPLKRKKMEEASVSASDPEEQTCSICFESWSNSGSHRVVSLKCGHLYGLTCIEKWLRSSGGEKCPQCNFKAKRSDIRPVYARTVTATDTTEKDHALRLLEEEKQLRIQAQRDEAQALLQQNLARSECDRLREEVLAFREENRALREQLALSASRRPASTDGGTAGNGCAGRGGDQAIHEEARERSGYPLSSKESLNVEGKYGHLKSISVSQTGNARVLVFEPQLGMLGISKSSDISLTPGHGILKLSMLDLHSKEFVGVHASSAVIRDMKFRPDSSGMVLTAATDKSARLTNLQSNTVMQTLGLSAPGWACAWDSDQPMYCYCGLQNGSVEVFDIRMPSQRVSSLLGYETTSGCPITSIAAIRRDFSSKLNCGGLLVGSLGGCTFLEKSSSSNFKPHILSTLPEGPCPSVSFEASTRHCLASFRPTRRSPEGKHTLFQLHNVPTDRPLTCYPVQQFPGGPTYRLLSRSRLLLHPGSSNRLLAAYSHESSKTVHVWDTCSVKKLQELTLSGEPALDVLPFGPSPDCPEFLGLLTQKTLHIYQWQ